MSNLKHGVRLLALRTESLGYSTLTGAAALVTSMFVSSEFINSRICFLLYRITLLRYTYRCATLKAAYAC